MRNRTISASSSIDIIIIYFILLAIVVIGFAVALIMSRWRRRLGSSLSMGRTVWRIYVFFFSITQTQTRAWIFIIHKQSFVLNVYRNKLYSFIGRSLGAYVPKTCVVEVFFLVGLCIVDRDVFGLYCCASSAKNAAPANFVSMWVYRISANSTGFRL